MTFIAYNRLSQAILAVAFSPASALKVARSHPAAADAEINTILCSEALAAAIATGGAAHWGFDARGMACLPDELGRAA